MPQGLLVVLLAGAALLVLVLSLGVGPVSLPPKAVLGAFFAPADDPAHLIVMQLRLPRVLLALAIGGMLGLSGAALQGLLRNPLAEPSLFGAPQCAALCAVITIALGWNTTLSWGLPVAAIAGAFASVALLLGIAGRGAGLVVLILSGLAVSALAGAGTVLAMNLAPNPFAALEIAFWLMGSLEDRSFKHLALALPFILPAMALLLVQGRGLRALTLGEEAAESLGMHVSRMRLIIIGAVAMGVGAGVAVAGAIGFVGLVAPHLLRPLVGHDPARLLLPSALAGALLLALADVATRIIPANTEIKVGVLTALLGVPFLLVLIARSRASLAGGAP
jgi:iron complex transport system permease protein